jgi:hypothetical protein
MDLFRDIYRVMQHDEYDKSLSLTRRESYQTHPTLFADMLNKCLGNKYGSKRRQLGLLRRQVCTGDDHADEQIMKWQYVVHVTPVWYTKGDDEVRAETDMTDGKGRYGPVFENPSRQQHKSFRDILLSLVGRQNRAVRGCNKCSPQTRSRARATRGSHVDGTDDVLRHVRDVKLPLETSWPLILDFAFAPGKNPVEHMTADETITVGEVQYSLFAIIHFENGIHFSTTVKLGGPISGEGKSGLDGRFYDYNDMGWDARPRTRSGDQPKRRVQQGDFEEARRRCTATSYPCAWRYIRTRPWVPGGGPVNNNLSFPVSEVADDMYYDADSYNIID